MEKVNQKNFILTLLLTANLIFLNGCQTAYYNTLEKFGIHKRDLMVERVEDARDSQEEAKEQFQSALEQFSSVLGFKGGKLEDKYKKLNAEYERSESKAEEVHKRISLVEDVAEDLFNEWEEELKQYSNETLRRDSKKKLARTKEQYAQLIKAMKRAEKKITPVLTAFKDQVLFLKHNLNAQAIASLQNELVSMQDDIKILVKEMEASIGEANAFISTMLKE